MRKNNKEEERKTRINNKRKQLRGNERLKDKNREVKKRNTVRRRDKNKTGKEDRRNEKVKEKTK